MKKIIVTLMMVIMMACTAYGAEKETRYRTWWTVDEYHVDTLIEDTYTRNMYHIYYNDDYTKVVDVILVKDVIEDGYMVGSIVKDLYDPLRKAVFVECKPIRIYY